MVDEEVLPALVRRDEAEPLVVTEPLHGSAGHFSEFLHTLLRRISSPAGRAQRTRNDAVRQRMDREAQRLTGTSISRLRILPVGPLGSSSTNQIARGYL